MIKHFEESFLSDRFNYNDPSIDEWANNVFEKIRKSGILAEYVTRTKEDRTYYDIIDVSSVAPIFTKDSRFTFGYAYIGGKLEVISEDTVNLETVYQIEFELVIDDINRDYDIAMFSQKLLILRTNDILLHTDYIGTLPVVEGEIMHIKIVRVHDLVKLYVNKELIQTTNLSSDDDTQYHIVYELGDFIPN